MLIEPDWAAAPVTTSTFFRQRVLGVALSRLTVVLRRLTRWRLRGSGKAGASLTPVKNPRRILLRQRGTMGRAKQL